MAIDYNSIPMAEDNSDCADLEHDGVERVTKKAVGVKIGDDVQWFPRSVVVSIGKSEIEVQAWFADKEGLI